MLGHRRFPLPAVDSSRPAKNSEFFAGELAAERRRQLLHFFPLNLSYGFPLLRLSAPSIAALFFDRKKVPAVVQPHLVPAVHNSWCLPSSSSRQDHLPS